MSWWRHLRTLFSAESRERWEVVGRVEEFPPETVCRVVVRGVPIAIFHTQEGWWAIGDVCPHMGASLSEGTVYGSDVVECPAHALRFSLKTGVCLDPHPYNVRAFPLRIEEKWLYIRV